MGRALQVGIEHRQQLVGEGLDVNGQGRIPVIGAWRGEYVVGHAGILAAGAWPDSGRIPVLDGIDDRKTLSEAGQIDKGRI